MGMLKCQKNNFVCIGDLKYRITLQIRAVTVPKAGVDFSETYTNIANVWASVKIITPKEIFSQTNIDPSITHQFIIRNRDDLTIDNWILFRAQRFNVLSLQKIDFENKFLQLNCNVKGAATEESSKW